MCALREEGDEKKAQHCQVAKEPPLTGEVGILEDAATRILDKMPRLNAKGT